MKRDRDDNEEIIEGDLEVLHNINKRSRLSKEVVFDLGFEKLNRRTDQMLADDQKKIEIMKKIPKLIENSGEEIFPGIKVNTTGLSIVFEQDLNKFSLDKNQRLVLQYVNPKNKKVSKLCCVYNDRMKDYFDHDRGNVYSQDFSVNNFKKVDQKYLLPLRLVLQEKVDNKSEYEDLESADTDILMKFVYLQMKGIDIYSDRVKLIPNEKEISEIVNERLKSVADFCGGLNELVDKKNLDSDYKIKQILLHDGEKDDRKLNYYNFRAFPEQGKIYGNVNFLEKDCSLLTFYHEAAHIYLHALPKNKADVVCQQTLKDDYYKLIEVCGLDPMKLDYKTEYRPTFEKNELFGIIDESKYMENNLSGKEKDAIGHPFDGFEEMFASIIAITQIPQYREQMIYKINNSSLTQIQKSVLLKTINHCLQTMDDQLIDL